DESIGCKAGLCVTERFSNVRTHPDEVKKNLLILIDEFAEHPPTSKTSADDFRRIFSLMYDWIYTPLYSRSIRFVDDEMYTIEEINMAIYHHKMGCIIYPQDGGIFTIKKIHLD
ncbi:MAG: hypothetical protein NC489_36290, partial [Ruminococcus flavefaciens]|nr:hypothetical protein [Ruminococcus flavefaciens]